MSQIVDWLDRTVGRLIFRAFGAICALVAMVCAYSAWRVLADWNDDHVVPLVLFGLVAIAAASCVPYCFSRRRTLGEALDGLEGGGGDTSRRR